MTTARDAIEDAIYSNERRDMTDAVLAVLGIPPDATIVPVVGLVRELPPRDDEDRLVRATRALCERIDYGIDPDTCTACREDALAVLAAADQEATNSDAAPEGAASWAPATGQSTSTDLVARFLIDLAESLPNGWHASIVHCRKGAYSTALWRVIVLPNDRRHRRVKGRFRAANGATLADAITAAAALIAERPLDELPDLGPNPKRGRLRQHYVPADQETTYRPTTVESATRFHDYTLPLADDRPVQFDSTDGWEDTAAAADQEVTDA